MKCQVVLIILEKRRNRTFCKGYNERTASVISSDGLGASCCLLWGLKSTFGSACPAVSEYAASSSGVGKAALTLDEAASMAPDVGKKCDWFDRLTLQGRSQDRRSI